MTGRAAGMNGHTRSMTTPATPRSPSRDGTRRWTISYTSVRGRTKPLRTSWSSLALSTKCGQCRSAYASTPTSAPIAGAHCRLKLLKEVNHAS